MFSHKCVHYPDVYLFTYFVCYYYFNICMYIIIYLGGKSSCKEQKEELFNCINEALR